MPLMLYTRRQAEAANRALQPPYGHGFWSGQCAPLTTVHFDRDPRLRDAFIASNGQWRDARGRGTMGDAREWLRANRPPPRPFRKMNHIEPLPLPG
jgi:hypothetical protein